MLWIIACIVAVGIIVWWERQHPMSTRRKLMIATWSAPSEPNVYGRLVVNAEPALQFISDYNKRTGDKITITHIVAKAIGIALSKIPTLNGKIVLGHFIPYQDVSLSLLVAINEDDPKNADLGFVKISNVDKLTLSQLADQTRFNAEKLRKGKDAEFNKSQGLMKLLPTWAIRFVVNFGSFLATGLSLNIPAMGIKANPFGAAVITSVAKFDIDDGFVPQTPFARVSLFACCGAIKKKPAVVDDQLVIQQQMVISATVDHRFMDGAQAAVLQRIVRDVMENPANHCH